MADQQLRDIYAVIERYAVPLLGRERTSSEGLSKEENRILALQNVNRLNQRIGFLAREKVTNSGDMRILQTYVNSLTIGLKSDNTAQMKAALSNIRNFLFEFDSEEQDTH